MRPYIFPLMSTLYLVPTPLGDPDDITLRALRILREVRAIATTKDDQVIKNLLDAQAISTQIIPSTSVLDTLALGDVAVVAKAGTPGLGDAAHDLVVEALARGIRVEPLPGASAEITALVLSGLPTDAFVYVGTLSDDLSLYAHEHNTLIFTTRSVTAALQRLLAALGDRRVCLTARLTQPDETIYRGMLSHALTDDRSLLFAEGDMIETVIVVEGAAEEVAEAWDESRVRLALRQRLAEGEPLKLAAKAVAALAGWDRRAVYALGVDEKRDES